MKRPVRLPLIVLPLLVTVAGVAKASADTGDSTGRLGRGVAIPAIVAVVPKPLTSPARPAPPAQPAPPTPGATRPAAGDFDRLMALGAAGVSMMLLCRSQQTQFPVFRTGTVVGALLAGVYGFLQGAWPLGVALTVYAFVSAVRTRRPRIAEPPEPEIAAPVQTVPGRGVSPRWADPSRLERMFGRS